LEELIIVNFADIQQSLQAYVDKLNSNIFDSIAQNGLVPLGSIDKKCLVNFVLGTSPKVQQNICVNYLDLQGCNEKKINAAITVALWEEYTGLFGISLERAWPFSSCQQQNIFIDQVKQRIFQNIVFVLKPPAEKVIACKIPNTNKSIQVCYQKNNFFSTDGFSQVRGLFLTGSSDVTSEHVTEIKTEKHFSSDDILAVLVPEHLMALAKKYFPDSFNIITVPMAKPHVALSRIPTILSLLHGQLVAEGGALTCPAPDYEKILKEKIIPQYGNFSLHAVRLITPYDISMRYIDNLSNTQKILEATQAEIVTRYADGSGWALVHASQVFKPSDKAVKRLASASAGISVDKFTLERVNAIFRDGLMAAKGSHAMINYFDTLNEQARRNLSALGIKGVALNGYTVLSMPEQYKDQIHKDMNAVLREGEARLKAAATCLQNLVRGHQVRTLIMQYKTAQEQYALARQRLAEAGLTLDNIGKKLGIKD
jgi:hypothetical protein